MFKRELFLFGGNEGGRYTCSMDGVQGLDGYVGITKGVGAPV